MLPKCCQVVAKMLPKQSFKAKEKSQITYFEKEAIFFIKNPAKTVSNGERNIKMLVKCCQIYVFRQKKNSQIVVLERFGSFCKWCHQESNRGHKDFQSFALPTELWHRCFCVCKGMISFWFVQMF